MILEIGASVYEVESECHISSPLLLGKSLKLRAKGEMRFANRPPEKMCVRLCIVQKQEGDKRLKVTCAGEALYAPLDW